MPQRDSISAVIGFQKEVIELSSKTNKYGTLKANNKFLECICAIPESIKIKKSIFIFSNDKKERQ